MQYLSIAMAILKHVPTALKFLPTILKFLPEIIAIYKQAKELADKVQKDSGADIADTIKVVLSNTAKAIPKPHKMTPEEEKKWMERWPTDITP